MAISDETDAREEHVVMFSFRLETIEPKSMARIRNRLAGLLGGDVVALVVHPDDAALGLVRLGYRFEGHRGECVLTALERCAKVSKATWTVDPLDLSRGRLAATANQDFRTAGVKRADLWIEPLSATEPLPVDTAASSPGN